MYNIYYLFIYLFYSYFIFSCSLCLSLVYFFLLLFPEHFYVEFLTKLLNHGQWQEYSCMCVMFCFSFCLFFFCFCLLFCSFLLFFFFFFVGFCFFFIYFLNFIQFFFFFFFFFLLLLLLFLSVQFLDLFPYLFNTTSSKASGRNRAWHNFSNGISFVGIGWLEVCVMGGALGSGLVVKAFSLPSQCVPVARLAVKSFPFSRNSVPKLLLYGAEVRHALSFASNTGD